MATILFVWECGGGNGHLARYRYIIDQLHDHGHETYFAVRNLRSAAKVYPDPRVGLLVAPRPSKNPGAPQRVEKPASYLDVLVNQCFDNQENLQSRVRAWLTLFRAVDPRLIIVDHGPTALIALKAFSNSEYIVSGSGFSVPPSQGLVLPFLQNSGLTEHDLFTQDQNLVSGFLNPCLAAFNGPELNSCMDIFDQPQRIFGIPELDHYANTNRNELFIGDQKSSGGKDALWPKTQGPKVFIYSESHPKLQALLDILSQLKWPVIAVAKQPAKKLISRFQSDSISYSEELLNIEKISQECDFAITNANMATCMNFIKNGKPMLLLPTQIEQAMFAQRLTEKKCGINLNHVNTSQELEQTVLQIADPNGTNQIQARAFATEIEPSLESNADEIMIEELMRLLK